jgi:uncharacterized protein
MMDNSIAPHDPACTDPGCGHAPDPRRRRFLAAAAGTLALGAVGPSLAAAAERVNLAGVAQVTTSYHTPDSALDALRDGATPADSRDPSGGYVSTGEHHGNHWIEYAWPVPVSTDRAAVYWYLGFWDVRLPTAYRLSYWDGAAFVPVRTTHTDPIASDRFLESRFEPVTTTRLRLDFTTEDKFGAALSDWQVWSTGPIPSLPPVAEAGVDRSVIVGGRTYLSAVARSTAARGAQTRWRKLSGPGKVTFASPLDPATTATFSQPGTYELAFEAKNGKLGAASRLTVKAVAAPPRQRLDVVYTKRYTIDNPLWNGRAKALLTRWIPHVIDYCERTDLPTGTGGIDNFIEAAKANRGEPHGPHKGYVFSNAYVLETVEAICIALMVDPQGDPETIAAQDRMRATLERWIPIILAAQEPDGYLQTAKTLAKPGDWPERWSPAHRGDHEGYVAGYFIESAINHYTLTEGRDLRLYDAARKLANCWVAHIGPGKKAWFDGHQEMEQALVRFGRFVNDMEGQGHGDAYIALAQFLLESRRGGSSYDQSHLPPVRQYEAVGHAVRATYFYSGMADIAAETGNVDYQSAVLSLWDNMVNRKYYITGGIGSGETPEGFGANYSLPQDAYCESCSSCGLIFFQYKMNLAYHDARYADLYEHTLYNALLGSVDLAGGTFCYTNPLSNTERTVWHSCPCCVANIPRTLLMLPTWTYVKGEGGLYVNLFVGSTMRVENVAGTDVEMVQKTDYPWNGAVAITVNPARPTRFALRVRIPDRTVSALYTATPRVAGYKSLKVNGQAIAPAIDKGYAVIEREWKAGDRVELDLPMMPQRIVADHRVEATRGKVAFAYGPIVYNVEKADQPDIGRKIGNAPIGARWRPDLLGGVVALTGRWADGSAMLAVPHYARMNRAGLPVKFAPDGPVVDYAPGSTGVTIAAVQPAPAAGPAPIRSQVWVDA